MKKLAEREAEIMGDMAPSGQSPEYYLERHKRYLLTLKLRDLEKRVAELECGDVTAVH